MVGVPSEQQRNFDLFRDCLATVLIDKVRRPQPKARRRAKAKTKTTASRRQQQQHAETQPAEVLEPETQSVVAGPEKHNDAEDFADFIDYLAGDTFESLPEELKTLDYHGWARDSDLQARYALPLTGHDTATLLPSLAPSVPDSLGAYGITNEASQGVNEFLAPVLTAFVTALATPPPPPSATKDQADGCELCDRDWVPLTYHHLIPRFVHAKAVKRGWHREEDLQNVAWLCRACHTFVHNFASHEDLARHYYTVDLLLEQDEVVQFAKWAGKIRWKGR